ncbi:MAG: BrnT family toxin [Chloroflexi bacterium]|nr:BrnT family toxin [Chloroflexota bacterium]
MSKHDVQEYEPRQLFMNAPRIRFAERGQYAGENVYVAYGQTDGGRYLVAFFIYKLNRVALVLSARDMDDKERRQYARK